MDQQAANLLATLRRTGASQESKLTLLNNLKSDIKHFRVPDSAQPQIFDCLKLAITQQASSNIVTAALSTFGHLIKRLKIQDAEGHAIAAHAPKLLPALLERLGDPRESHRTGASQILADLWPFCGAELERTIRDDAIGGSHARAKEAGMKWVVKMHHDVSLPFKNFVPHLVSCLEDPDGAVRDAAKGAIADLFCNAPDRAKADLRKQLKLHNVRHQIQSQVLSQIGSTPVPEADLAASTRSLPTIDHAAHFSESINSEASKPPPKEEVPLDPIYLHSQRELEDMIRDMLPHFEGREEEFNWTPRDKSVTKLRRVTKGNAPSDFHVAFTHGIKTMQEPILKAANSLRTTISTNACQLVQELARTLGPAMDSMVEIFLQSFIKMSAATKHIAAQNGNITVDTLFQYVSYNVRLVQHVSFASQEKNAQPRTHAAGWIRTILERQAGHKSHFESTGGLDLVVNIIKKGLADANPKVKEAMRATYWTFAKSWPDKAEAIMSTLDDKAQATLRKDPHNPNASATSSSAGPSASALGRSAGAQSRSSLRDTIAAQRKKAASGMPDRPNSAMATLSPVKSQSRSDLRSRGHSTLSTTQTASARVPSNASGVSSTGRSAESGTSNTSTVKGSLMSGPVRRPRPARPEIARPATADPYSSRRLLRPETPSNKSPLNSPPKSTATKPTAASAARERAASVRNSPARSPVKQATPPQPSKLPAPKPARQSSPQAVKQTTPQPARQSSRPSSKGSIATGSEEPEAIKEDDFTMVIPTSKNAELPTAFLNRRPAIDKTMSVDSGIPAITEEDGFTMVIPSLQSLQRERSPLASRSAVRSITEEAAEIPAPPSARSSPSQSVQRRSRTPERSDTPIVNAPPSRQGSPLKTSTLSNAPQEEIKIYEDPFTGAPSATETPATPTPQNAQVLHELPITGNNIRESSVTLDGSPAASDAGSPRLSQQPNGITPPPLSPTSKAEVLRSRKLLNSGIERIRARSLDCHGLRKVLDLARSPETAEIFGSEGRRFNDLMLALLDFVTSAEVLKQDLKRQAVCILKVLLTASQYRKWVAQSHWHPRALTAIFEARRHVEGLGLLVKELEGLAQEVVRLGKGEECVDAVASYLQTTTTTVSDAGAKPSSAHATALALSTLTSLITLDSTVLAQEKGRVAAITAAHLTSPVAEVRKKDVELATELHARWPTTGVAGSEDFWAALEKESVQESTKSLIMYFIARRERAAATAVA